MKFNLSSALVALLGSHALLRFDAAASAPMERSTLN
jgi:hypothetical protein